MITISISNIAVMFKKVTDGIVLFGQDKAGDALIAARGCWQIRT